MFSGRIEQFYTDLEANHPDNFIVRSIPHLYIVQFQCRNAAGYSKPVELHGD
jgi:hypothetical protein